MLQGPPNPATPPRGHRSSGHRALAGAELPVSQARSGQDRTRVPTQMQKSREQPPFGLTHTEVVGSRGFAR